MTKPDFETTYTALRKQLTEIDYLAKNTLLGAKIQGNELVIPFYGIPHRISRSGVTDMAVGIFPPLKRGAKDSKGFCMWMTTLRMTLACNLTPCREFRFFFVSTTVTKSSRPNASSCSGGRLSSFLIYKASAFPARFWRDH